MTNKTIPILKIIVTSLSSIFSIPPSFLADLGESDTSKFETTPSLWDELKFNILHIYRIYRYNLFLENPQNLGDVLVILLKISRKVIQGRHVYILFYPEFPFYQHQNHSLYQVCLFNGYRITNNPFKAINLAIKWKDDTFPKTPEILRTLTQRGIRVLNIGCEDISKSTVDTVFQEVFGYGLRLDPRIYTGQCVMKSELNSRHDGKIIQCPIENIQENVIYQKLIDNQTSDSCTLDYRVPVLASTYIPFVYKKYLPLGKRFGGFSDLVSASVVEVSEVFSEDEVDKILEFCHRLKVDHAELDILRDKYDGKIYIVDLNVTAYSRLLANLPNRKLAISECLRCVSLTSLGFQKFLRPRSQPSLREP